MGEGVVSVPATRVSVTIAESRMACGGRRPGIRPAWLAVVRSGTHVPVRALLTFVGAGLAVIAVRAVARPVGVGTGPMDPVGLYAEPSAFGTIVVPFVHLLAMEALPRHGWTWHRKGSSVLCHAVPLAGVTAPAMPFVSTCRLDAASPLRDAPLGRPTSELPEGSPPGPPGPGGAPSEASRVAGAGQAMAGTTISLALALETP